MRLNEIYLSENDTNKLADLLESYNKDRSPQEKLSFQELAEKLLKDAINSEWIRTDKGG